MELDNFIGNVKQLDEAMMGLLNANSKLLNEETYSLWMALMMSIGMEPDCTESYQTLAGYQHITGSGIDMDAYYDFACLSPNIKWDPETDDEAEEQYDDLSDELLDAYCDVSDGLPDGKYYVYAYHNIDSKLRADTQVGFTDTIWWPSQDPKYRDKGWGYAQSHLPVEVRDGRIQCFCDLAHMIQDAHARSGYWGTFFEGVEFNKQLNGFEVCVGS